MGWQDDPIVESRPPWESDPIVGEKPAEKKSKAKDTAGYMLGAALEPLLTLGTGAVATPVAGLFGIGASVANLLGGKNAPDKVVEKVQQGLTYTPKSEGGRDVVEKIAWPFEMIGRSADMAGGAVTDATGWPSLGAATNTAINMLPSVLGMRLSKGGVSTLGDAAEGTSKWLMTKSLKPPMKESISGKGAQAVETLLKENLSPNRAAAERLRGEVANLSDQVTEALLNSNAYVGKDAVLRRVADAEAKARNQVAPQADLEAISRVADSFANHPDLPRNAIPIMDAQRIKQGTYQYLKDNYGKLGGGDIEGQKAVARGLRETIEAEVPEVGPLNARQSELINAMKLVERRLPGQENANPAGIAAVAPTNLRLLAFLADRSDMAKAMIARALYPGERGKVPNSAIVSATGPETFSEDAKKRQAIIDALMGRR